MEGGKDINNLVEHVDLLPTLAALCNLPVSEKMQLDGQDFSPLLTGEKNKIQSKVAFIHHRQDWRQPKDVEETCIMQDQWRLINGKELYDIEKDPKQRTNLATKYPKLVSKLLKKNAKFLERAKENSEYYELPVSVAGNKAQNEIKLTIQHAIGEDGGIWKPEQVAAGMKNTNNKHALKVEKSGLYQISCRRWPKECPGPILGIPEKNPKNLYNYQTISPEKVRISIANQIHEKVIKENDEFVSFKVNLLKGKTLLTNDFIQGDSSYGVYYTYIKYIGNLK
ncbi:sulfatase/phosphatase domain-containing protein [Polaribacter staleyi]|uniref:sulfatase/phosphatase domain-containing protein n=1 Tax=Polaribacter staleyi TaxID=2022337 RepID=UPI0031BA6A1C